MKSRFGPNRRKKGNVKDKGGDFSDIQTRKVLAYGQTYNQCYTESKKILLALSEGDFSFPTVSTAPVKRLNSVAEHLELEYDESSFSSKTELTRRQNMLKVAATSLGSQAKSHFFDLLYPYIVTIINRS